MWQWKCIHFLTMVNEGEGQVFMSDSKSSLVIGQGKVLLKLTFGKVLALSDVLHVLSIRWNLCWFISLHRPNCC